MATDKILNVITMSYFDVIILAIYKRYSSQLRKQKNETIVAQSKYK